MPDFGKYISNSYEAIKKNKWLFVYGLVIALFAGGSGSGGSNIDLSDGFKNIPKEIPEDIPEKTSLVLGTYTSALLDWFSSVPVTTWLLLGLSGLLFVILALAVRIVLLSWAKGALISGFEKAFNNEEVDLTNTSPKGISSIKNLVIFAIIASLVATGLLLGIFLVWLIIFLIFHVTGIEELRIIWMILGSIMGFFTFVVAIILFAMIGVYAERLIVLEKYSPWPAWKKAFSLSKGNFFPTLVTGLVNNVLGCSIGCASMIVFVILLGIPGFIILYPSISNGTTPPLSAIIILMVAFMIFSYLNLLIGAFVVLLKYGNWNQLFREVLIKQES